MYVLLFEFVYIPGIFGGGDMCIRARFTAVNTYFMCDYSGMCVSRLYIFIVITYSKGKDQPGKVVNVARGQLAEQGI